MKNWEDTITNLTEKYKNPELFWKEVKRLRGGTINSSSYIQVNNQKIYKEEEKEPIFRNIWETVFQISPQENLQFDPVNEHTVNNYLRDNPQQCTHFTTSDITRLERNNYLTSPITLNEINSILK